MKFTSRMTARMLVLLSNLHLTDGSCGDHSASDRLSGALNELQYALKGSHSTTEKVDVVLLGDTFDFVTSRKWYDNHTRPWDLSLQSNVANTVEMIFEDIVTRYSHGFSILNRLLEDGIEVGLSQKSSSRIPIQFHYMVGDTDRMLHHFGPAYEAIRARVCELLRLSNSYETPFPHEPIESETILSLFGEYGIFARHGDLQDPWSCEGDRRASSVNELMQIELVQPFVQEILQTDANHLSNDAREQLIELIHSHHVSQIHATMLSFSEKYPEGSRISKRVLESWHDYLDQFLRHKKLQNRTAWQPLDLVAELRKRLTINKNLHARRSIASHFWLDRNAEDKKQTAWIPKANASKSDSDQTQFFVNAHYSSDVILEVFDRPVRVNSLPLRHAA